MNSDSGKGFKDPLANKDASVVCASLKSGEALVDFVSYTGRAHELSSKNGMSAIDAEKPPRLAAIILSPEGSAFVNQNEKRYGSVTFVDLGRRDDLAKAITSWRQSVETEATTRGIKVLNSTPDQHPVVSVDAGTAQLKSLVIDKIMPKLAKRTSKIWLCPDAETALIPWNVIAADTITITEIDSPRALVALVQSRDANKASSSPSAVSSAPIRSVLTVGNIEYADPKQRVQNLDATAVEVKSIAEIAESQKLPVIALTRTNATKDKVMESLPNATYSHIATHGFTRQATMPAQPVAPDTLIAIGAVDRSFSNGKLSGRNPLVDTGLFFAYPTDSKVAPDEEPGILTAEEVVGLDLKKCQLLTLSACETGLGRPYTGQGLIGLRSAALAAGARSTLMALWSVPDEATEKLMVEFYKNLWEKGKTKSESLRWAQESVKNNPEHPEWKNPYYWAAWVLAGEGWN